MNNEKTEPKDKPTAPKRDVKPKAPDKQGAPDDNDPNAQYEDKDES